MLGIGLSLGISPTDFWMMTPLELDWSIKAIAERSNAMMHMQWDIMRTGVFYLIDIQLPKKSKISYKEFKEVYMSFPWEHREQKTPLVISESEWDSIEGYINKLS